MREIKFRVWDKDLKHMHIVGTGHHDSIVFGKNNRFEYRNMQNGCGSGDESDTYILMQFTGVLDKNKKEIYEGDIVICKEYPFFGDDGLTELNYVGEIFISEEGDGYYLDLHAVSSRVSGRACGESISEYMGKLEVIGNIYQNPELLEDRK